MHIQRNNKGVPVYCSLNKVERKHLAYRNIERIKLQRVLEREEVRMKLNKYGVV